MSHVTLRLKARRNALHQTEPNVLNDHFLCFKQQSQLLFYSVNQLTVCISDRSQRRYTSPDILEIALWSIHSFLLL